MLLSQLQIQHIYNKNIIINNLSEYLIHVA